MTDAKWSLHYSESNEWMALLLMSTFAHFPPQLINHLNKQQIASSDAVLFGTAGTTLKRLHSTAANNDISKVITAGSFPTQH